MSNNFTDVAAETCTIGYDLGSRVNETRFCAGQANNCLTGYNIVDINDDVVIGC